MTSNTDAWIAYDPQHRPQRAWRMAGSAPQSAALRVDNVAAAQALAPGDALWSTDAGQQAAVPVPAKPSELPVLTQSNGAENIFSMADLEQARPFGRLAGAAFRIEGFLSLNKDWDGVICLPGFHATHWAQISADEVVSFLSFSTLALVEALCPVETEAATVDESALTATLADVLSTPETLALRMAETKARWSVGTLSDDSAAGQIWGAALAAELAASRSYWLGQNLALISPASLARPYRAALASQYVPVTEADESRMTLHGLSRARARWIKARS